MTTAEKTLEAALAEPSPAETHTDLGFGSVVARESHERLLNRDGSFNVRREGLLAVQSQGFYQWAVDLTWPRFLGVVSAGYLAVNLLFAFGYLALGEGAIVGSAAETLGERLLECFFFSVQTSSTIGYGVHSPGSLGANLLVTVETLFSLLGFALVTGLTWARFSRPTARIIASHQAVIAPYQEGTALMFRVANARASEMVQVEVKVALALRPPGSETREFHPLALERDRVQFFPLAWTIVHPIDEDSPLHGLGAAELAAAEPEVLVLLSGFDETFAGTVHSRVSYVESEIVWGGPLRQPLS